MSAELGHAVLYVSNLDRSVAFYRDVVGWAIVDDGLFAGRAAMFSSGRTHHELLLIEVGEGAAPIPTGRRVGLYHLGVKVGTNDDELRAVRDRVLDRPDLTRFVGTADHHVSHSLYVTDPDGNEIELYIDVADADWSNVAEPAVPLSL